MGSALTDDVPAPSGQLIVLGMTYLALAITAVFIIANPSDSDQGTRDVFGLAGFYAVFGAPVLCLVLAALLRRTRAISTSHQVAWRAALAYPVFWVALIALYFVRAGAFSK